MEKRASIPQDRLPAWNEVILDYQKAMLVLLQKIAERKYGTEGGVASIRQLAAEANVDRGTASRSHEMLTHGGVIHSESGEIARVKGEEGIEIARTTISSHYRSELKRALGQLDAFCDGNTELRKAALACQMDPHSVTGLVEESDEPGGLELVGKGECQTNFVTVSEEELIRIAKGELKPGGPFPSLRELRFMYDSDLPVNSRVQGFLRNNGFITKLPKNQGYQVGSRDKVRDVRSMLRDFYRTDIEQILSETPEMLFE